MHNRALTPFLHGNDYQANTTFSADGRNIFGYLRPDGHKEQFPNGRLVEGKPLSYRDNGAKYAEAQREVREYQAMAAENGYSYLPEDTSINGPIFAGRAKIPLGVVKGYLGETVQVTLYPDKNPNSGVLFYGLWEEGGSKLDQAADEIRSAVNEIIKRGIPIGGPPVGGRRPSED